MMPLASHLLGQIQRKLMASPYSETSAGTITKIPEISGREESLSTEISLIDMLYSPVCAVLRGEGSYKVSTDRYCPAG